MAELLVGTCDPCGKEIAAIALRHISAAAVGGEGAACPDCSGSKGRCGYCHDPREPADTLGLCRACREWFTAFPEEAE